MPADRKRSDKTVLETLGIIHKGICLGDPCWCNFTSPKISRFLERIGCGNIKLNLNTSTFFHYWGFCSPDVTLNIQRNAWGRQGRRWRMGMESAGCISSTCPSPHLSACKLVFMGYRQNMGFVVLKVPRRRGEEQHTSACCYFPHTNSSSRKENPRWQAGNRTSGNISGHD